MKKRIDELREQVLEANLETWRHKLAIYTFGNASGISRTDGLVVIKPSGVSYESMRAADMVVTDLEGRVVEGTLRPSSDLATHLILYRSFPAVGGVVHTHSTYATAWAQAGIDLPCVGTTHADYFHGAVPVTDMLSKAEIEADYERNTGDALVRRIAAVDPLSMPAVLAAGHGPFCWGASPLEAAHIAVILEEVARMTYSTMTLRPATSPLPQALIDKHFFRKHGAAATYGQH